MRGDRYKSIRWTTQLRAWRGLTEEGDEHGLTTGDSTDTESSPGAKRQAPHPQQLVALLQKHGIEFDERYLLD